MKLLLPLLLLCVLPLANAQVFKSVDENGRVTFSDQPASKDAKEVELAEPNIAPAIAVTPKVRSEKTLDADVPNYEIWITQPSAEFHLNPGQRNLSVQYQSNFPLQTGMYFQVLSNGEPVGEPTRGNSVSIDEITRGAYVISVLLFDDSDKLLASSNTVSGYVRRASIHNPKRKKP